MPYHRASTLEGHAAPLGHSLEALSETKAAGLSFYEEDGSLVYLSYGQLRSHAQQLAGRLKQAVNVSATPRLLVDPDLPRCDLLVAFWGCIYAEICPCFLGCIAAFRSQQALEMLGSPPLLFNSQKSRSRLPGLDLADLASAATAETSSPSPLAPTTTAFQVVAENDESQLVLYSYSHDSIWANSMGMKQIFSVNQTSLKSLSWMPISPFTLLWHCAAVFHAASEIHVDLRGLRGLGLGGSQEGPCDPCSSMAPWHFLRCLRRHAGELLVAAPLIFYRRMLGRPLKFSFGKVRWLLLSKDDWQMEDVRSLLSHREEQKQDLEFHQLLVAPWGAALAHAPLGSNLFASPLPGVELRQWPLMARGLQALPGAAVASFGWRSLGGAAQREQLRISGVEYSSAEVETALELSPLVCPGSTVACSAGSGGGLVIFFVPKDGTISARDALVKSLAAHLALALGLHVERWVPLPAATLPRSVEGTPRREVLKGWLHGVQDTALADTPLPADWVFEEDFKAQALTSTVEVDEDAIEERMEGAALDPDVHSPKQLLLIIAGSSVSDLSAQILRAAGDGTGGSTQCRAVDSTEAALAVMQTMEGLELMVLHLLQCEDSDGTKEVVSVIQLLQTWERKHSTLNLKVPALKLLCVSTGRHMRVAGDAMDPRKHFLSGVLLSAALELPWLQVCQLDACPKLRQATLAEQLLQEIGSELHSSEVLLDADGARLLRRLRPAALAPQHRLQLLKQCRSILLAGGLGGIGSLWAQHLGAEQLLLLGRRPRSAASPQLEELRRGNSEIVYISADICKKQQLRSALQNCPAMKVELDFAACLCESFEPPQSVLQLDAMTAMNGPQEKLRGAENFIEVLKDLTSTTPFRRVPVLFASSAVSVTGAPQLGVYSAKARGLEALCMKEAAASARRKMLEIGCVALSAWDHVGITAAFPALASNAPALGLKTLTPQQGLEALEAVLRFQAPRFAVLMVGVDGQHPRVQALTGGSSSAATSTATVSGCVEMIQAAVRKVLGKEANLGDSFVELGLDSMSSMSLHSSLSDVSGVVLPLSLFYDEPSLLDAAKYLHRAAGAAGSGSGDEENLEALLQDDEARRSYHLSQGRSAMNAKDFHLAREKCRAASLGAVGHALIAALSLEAEACHALGDAAASGELLRRVLRTEEELHGAESADCCLALAKLIHLGEQSASHCHDFQRHHRRFLQTVAWVPSATSRSDVAPVEPAWEMRRLRWVNLDLQQLDGFSKDDLGALSGLEVLEVMTMRRNGLTELPGSFGQLQTLRELYLTGNCLSDLPESFCNLSKLQVLCLERNRLLTLPSAVYAISKRLLQLGLDEQEVPFSLDEQLLIPKLSILRARGCQAATFPKMLLGSKGLPSNLNTIFWANNGLLKLPDLRDASVAEALRSLRLLDLAHNQITSMDALTMSDCSLRHLRDLSLAGNRLTEIPAAIAQALPALQQLWLHGNQLKKLPEQLGELQSLAILELHHNRLRELPQSMGKLQKLNWFFAHGNELTDVHIIKTLNTLPRLKIVGLGCNQIPLQQIDFHSLHASYGLGWNLGIAAADEVLTEALTTTDLHWDRLVSDEVQQLLVITFSAQGAPVAQGQAEVRALRDAMLKVDALYVCDPANAWFLQDPTFQWKGLEYFEQKISSITSKYRRVFAWGGSMGGSASLLFAHLVDRVHAFSPQVDLAFTWPTFGTEEVRQQFRRQVQDSVRRCRGRGGEVHLHVGAENHTDNRHAAALTHAVVHLHETANHNTMKHVKQRGKLLPLLKFEVMDFLIQ